ncbi:MAG: EAL domain-containing protein [Woeseiaceae bacterium]|nr:EAL domain-containing protein [Woeseiaceae bacterium]
MAGRILSRYLVLVSIIALIGIGVILALFYGQYQWMASGIVTSSVEQHGESLAGSFERRARGQLYRIADAVLEADADTGTAVRTILDQAIIDNETLIGLRYTHADGFAIESGPVAEEAIAENVLWRPERMYMKFPIIRDGDNIGSLFGSFDLATLASESEAFEEQLVELGTQSRQTSFLWVGAATLITIVLCGFVIWLIAKLQAERIRALKVQAEKLSDADYGEPLMVRGGDLLADLAAVFNGMREKLKRTTISRDYVDSVLSSMNEAIIVTSPEGMITRVNAATTRMLKYTESELVGNHIRLIVDQKKGGSLATDTHTGVPREAFLLSHSDEKIPISYTSSSIKAEGNFLGHRIYAAQNITERRKAEKRIRYLARIDPLTKVPNRMQFQHLLQRTIARAKRREKSVALFYIDIDNFKEINDTFGHLAGDATLETVTERLKDTLPDKSVIGRLAGDEFAVIVDNGAANPDDRSALDKIAREVLDQLAEPFFVQGHEVFMTASMGIAFYPVDAPNVIDLIKNADAALYHAKKSGGNMHSYYIPEMNEAVVERLMTKSKLKRSFERDELLVHYQPKYNLQTGAVIGAEALVRWELPERGIILPSDFIPLAEETNLIIDIGEWVLERVCEDFRRWQKTMSSPGRVSVNLSLKQLRQPNFINRISAILQRYEVSPTSLELEITETTLMENPNRTIKILDQLYALGLHLAIDDFGTGYSSLSALQQFPISTLKIDKSFVQDIAVNADDATIVGTIIHMGQSLNMDVVAEGVESEEQLAFLQSHDCTYVQGLLFGDPMSSDNYLDLLMAQTDGTDQYRALFA